MLQWRGALLCMLLVVGSSRGDVVSLSATSDNFIVSTLPDNNGGANSHVAAGTANNGSSRPALFQFDLSSIPPGSVVTSAEFDVSVVIAPFGGADSTFSLYPVFGDWNEGAQSGNSGSFAAAGECTWNSRFSGATTWTNAGGDFAASPAASTPVSGLGAYAWTGAGLVSAVQDWVNGAAENDGLLLKSDAEGTPKTARGFGSREGSAAAVLVVGFAAPPPPPPPPLPLFTGIDAFPTNLALVWTNNPGRQYDVLYTRQLAGTQAWRIAEANIPASPPGTNVWTDPPVLASPIYATNAIFALSERLASPTSLVLQLVTVASNLVSPVVATHAGDGSGRLFIAEQKGQIRILDAATNLLVLPFLDLSSLITNLTASYDERGLLGLAFHPGYAINRKFYVYYSAPKTGPGINHESILAEYLATTTNANLADPASARIVLRFDEPENNHNGGSLSFGPDGYLYISTGDGGGAGDNHGVIGNAQNISNLLGKILRIDVDGGLPYGVPADNPFVAAPGADEIYAYGFRNPWRASFAGTNLWVADVGQDLWEEINLVRKGGNYGWRILEGNHAYSNAAALATAAAAGVNIAALDYPIHEYRHGPLGISIIGGGVYAGAGFPALTNKYVFGDFSTSFSSPDGALYYLDETRTGIWERAEFYLWPTNGRLHRFVKSFGRDEAGELYLLSTTNLGPTGISGDVRKLLPAP